MQNDISETEINDVIENVRQGDLRSFELIVKHFQKYAMNVAYKILYNENDAKEVVQDGFVKIWKNIKNYDSNTKFSTWMFKIIVHLCFDKLKSRRRKNFLFRDVAEENFDLKSSVDIEKDLSNREMVELIKYISKGLSEKQKMVFILRDVEDLSINEVVKITMLSESSVKANLFFARQNIRKKLIEYLK